MTNLFLFTAMDGVLIGVVVLMIGFMFWQGSKQRKAQADYMGMLDTLRIGMRVKMASGLLGRIKEIREEAPGFKTITVETGEGKNVSVLTFTIDAVQGVVNEEAINQLNMQAAAQAQTPAAESKTLINGEPAGFDAASYVEKRNEESKKKSKKDK